MRYLAAIAALLAALCGAASAQVPTGQIGIVVMHGKGGAPTKLVAGLASWLAKQGYLVANLDMPWSDRRNYDTTIEAAVAEVDAAIADLKSRGALKVFVCGHSLGGLFGLYYAGKRPLDGYIAIAPGGDTASAFYRGKLGPSVGRARELVAQGKGGERGRFDDYENARGMYPIETTAASYLAWFDPDGAINQDAAVRAVQPSTPVLYIVPTNDYPGLLRVKDLYFSRLPRNALTRLYEPSASHMSAPWDSHEEIARWIGEVAR